MGETEIFLAIILLCVPSTFVDLKLTHKWQAPKFWYLKDEKIHIMWKFFE